MVDACVLIVDDNDLDTKLARDVLRYHGFDTVEAGTAAEAMAVATACCPDLVLLDVQLPDADGVTLLAQIRADPRLAATPVVALTALAMPDDERTLLAAGFQAYLAKPIDVLELPGFLCQLLESSPQRSKN
jgi:two-component system cell cycle response regulator DivK